MSNIFNYIHEKKNDTMCLLLCGCKYGKHIIRYVTLDTNYMGRIENYHDGELNLSMPYYTYHDKIRFGSMITINVCIFFDSGEVNINHGNKTAYTTFYSEFVNMGDDKYNVLFCWFNVPSSTRSISITKQLWMNTITKQTQWTYKYGI